MYYGFEYDEVLSTWGNCVVPSVNSVIGKIAFIILFNLVFNIIANSVNISVGVFNILSIMFGNLLFYLTISDMNIFHFLIFLTIAYFIIYVMFNVHPRGGMSAYIIACMLITYLLMCEFFHPNQENWLESRGLFMIAAMKIISLSADMQKDRIVFPTASAFFGYTCFPANSLFGPWFPFKEYLALKENHQSRSFKWLSRILYTAALSFFYLTVSNCWGAHFIADDSHKWLLAYRQALSFRSSHYFVSYLSEAAMIAAGCSNSNKRNSWRYHITNPLDIELPSSLVSVVISWNIPMHKFLKQYVYKASVRFGHFKAIFITYMVSSLLHGFNLEIATVLLTIGIFSFVQLCFQTKVSSLFNACLNVRPCRHCNHKYKQNNVYVKLAHVMFSILTILHLIYLGILMEFIGEQDSPTIIEKWYKLDFLCHFVMFVMYIIYNVM